MIVKIEVTQEDIDQAREVLALPENRLVRSQFCPVALAAQRATQRPLAAGRHCLMTNYYADLCEIPWEARDFIESFDDDEPVKPFEFEVDLPPEYVPAEPITEAPL